MNTSNWTGRVPRTSSEAFGCDGRAIEVYRTPLPKRLFFGLIKHGWWLFALFLAVACLTGCVDIDTDRAAALAVSDLAKREGAE